MNESGKVADAEARTAFDVGQALRVMSEPTRYKIVTLLTQRHHCARSLSKTLGISESAVSQHMTLMRDAGLVTGFRHGYHIHYVLNQQAFEQIVVLMQQWLEQMEQVAECHDINPCQFQIGDDTVGCMYASTESERKGQK